MNSSQTVVSDGSLALLNITFEYFDRTHVHVLFNGVEQAPGTTWSWVGSTNKTIQFSPAVANGITVRVQRVTPLNAPRHVFRTPGNAPFNKSTMDENFRQALYASQEAAEGTTLTAFGQDVSANGNKLTLLGDAQQDGDAVNLKVLRDYLPNAALVPSITDKINLAVSSLQSELQSELEGYAAGQGAQMIGYTSGATVATALDALFAARPVQRVPVLCKAAAPLFDTTDYQPFDLNAAEAISRVDGHTGVLVQNTTGAYLDILLPYCVGIGDSIMEGHPALHGRLHPTYNPNQGSEPGQLPYELSKHFGLPVINNGWGGQTSVQIRARWPRDVLAQDVIVGDGMPFTMGFAGGKLPYMVYLHVGINDIFTDVPVATIKDNFRFFAQSCRDNKILLVLDNIGPDDDAGFTVTRQANAAEVNRWLANEFAAQFPEVYQMNYLHWASGGTNDFRTLRVGCFADDVHPTKAGYAMWAAHVARNLTAPVFMRGLLLNSWLDDISGGPNNFARPTSITVGGNTYALSSTEAQAIVRLANIDPDEPTYRVTISEATTITGGGTYTGFAGVYGVFASRYEPSKVEAVPTVAPVTTTGTWIPAFTGLAASGIVSAVGNYRELEGLVFFDVRITVEVGGTTASTGNTTYFTLPFAAKRRSVCMASNAQTANLGTGLIETGGGGTCFPPTWAASSQTVYISGCYERL